MKQCASIERIIYLLKILTGVKASNFIVAIINYKNLNFFLLQKFFFFFVFLLRNFTDFRAEN